MTTIGPPGRARRGGMAAVVEGWGSDYALGSLAHLIDAD
jgi:hypothetical protein